MTRLRRSVRVGPEAAAGARRLLTTFAAVPTFPTTTAPSARVRFRRGRVVGSVVAQG